MQLQECKSAEEVRALARAGKGRRRRLSAAPRPCGVAPAPVPVIEPFIPTAPETPPGTFVLAGITYERTPTIRAVLLAVSQRYLIDVSDITSARRTVNVVRPRQIAMYLAKQLTQRSLPEIGRRIGGRDHTTIIHGVRKIARLRQSDPDLDAELSELAAILKPVAE